MIKNLKIGNLIAKIPIIQGGMGVCISMSGLASAVANEGGIGVISAACLGMFEPDLHNNYREANIRALKKEIKKAREMTKGIVGVNIMVALSNYSDMVSTSIEEGIDIIFSGAGLPLDLPSYLKENSVTKLVPIVSSARAAVLLTKYWKEKFNYLPDAFVVEGPKAGGHLGFKPEQIDDKNYSLDKILTQVIEAVAPFEEKYKKAIPVIAAGGIFTGKDIFNMMSLGASGVQMATRFVTTTECDASQNFKNAYIQCRKEDIKIIDSPVGMPGRAINNDFIREVEQKKKHPFGCPYHCIVSCKGESSPYCISLALINAQKGLMSQGFAFAGANAYRTKKIITVKELINKLMRGFNRACRLSLASKANA